MAQRGQALQHHGARVGLIDQSAVHVGIAHHFGWAVAVTATAGHEVLDRRRVELIEPGLPVAPVHHEGGPHALHRTGDPLDDDTLSSLVDRVRASVVRAASHALDQLASELGATVASLSVRAWPRDFPADIAVQRRAPYESRADSIMYCTVLSDVARGRGWAVHHYDAKTVVADATRLLGGRTGEVLDGPRAVLGPPWSKDHRLAMAAAVVASCAR